MTQRVKRRDRMRARGCHHYDPCQWPSLAKAFGAATTKTSAFTVTSTKATLSSITVSFGGTVIGGAELVES